LKREHPTPAVTVPARRATLAAALAVVTVLALAAGGLAWKALRDPGVSFLGAGRAAAWIVYPAPSSLGMHPAVPLAATFRRSFRLANAPHSAELQVRALRWFHLSLNGRSVIANDEDGTWKRPRRVDVASLLRAGVNRLEVTVTNEMGPPALWVRLALPDQVIASDSRWETSWAGATWEPAVRADAARSCRRADPDGQIVSPARAFRTRPGTLALLVLLSIGIVVPLGRWARRRHNALASVPPAPWLFWGPLGVAAAAWTALFVNDARWLGAGAGFDATGHLDYVRYLLEHHAVPMADQGWQMYQPPLYYAIAALVLGIAGRSVPGPDGANLLRGLGLLSGIANLVLIGVALRLVFPGRPRRWLLGLVLAAFLPMSLCLYQLPTNETLAATLSSAVLLLGLLALRRERPRPGLLALLGLAMGLALLTKVSALLVVVVVLGVLGVRLARRPDRRPTRCLAELGLVVAVTALVCGWYYAWVWYRFGAPVVGNWEALSGHRWWQDPGYRTAADFLRFGRVFSAPYFAGLDGLWDGLYSTLWGDGLLSGEVSLWMAPPWCSSLMSAGYLVALLPSLALLVGGVAFLLRWIRHRDPVDGTLLAAAFVSFAALVSMTLNVPHYGTIKSFYALGALLPLCAFVALGLDLAAASLRRAGTLLLVLFGAWALLSYVSVWITPGSPRAGTFGADTAVLRGDDAGAIARLQKTVANDPSDWLARFQLARAMVAHGASAQEVDEFFAAENGLTPDLLGRHAALSQAAAGQGNPGRALAEARRCVALNPDMPDGHRLEARMLEAGGDAPGAIRAWREVLRVDPFEGGAHAALGRLLARAGDADSTLHRAAAARLAASSP